MHAQVWVEVLLASVRVRTMGLHGGCLVSGPTLVSPR